MPPEIKLVNPTEPDEPRLSTYWCEVGITVRLTLTVTAIDAEQARYKSWDFLPLNKPLDTFDQLTVEVQKPE